MGIIHTTTTARRHNWRMAFFSLFGATLILTQSVTTTVGALTVEDYIGQNILHYGDETAACNAANAAVGNITLTGSANAEKAFNFFTSTPIKTNGDKPLNAIQAAAFIGNFQKESTEAMDPAIENEIGALGIAQWLDRRSNLEAFAQQQGKSATDLDLQLAFVVHELEGSEVAIMLNSTFISGTDIDAITVAIRKVYERPGEAEADDPARIAYAQAAYAKYKGNAPAVEAPSTGGTATADPCVSAAGNGAVQGDLVKTALGFAWDTTVEEGKAFKADARPEYVAAMAEFSDINNDSDAEYPYSDCGRFVANVMRASGIDPNYPLVSTSAQLEYARGDSSMYHIIDNPSMSDFKTGDIFVSPAHTAIYTGDGGTFDTVDASLYGRVPGVSNYMAHYLGQSGAALIRYIGNGEQ